MRSWKWLLPLLASTLCLAQQPDRVATTIDSSHMVTLQNHVPPLAQSGYEQGLIDSSRLLNVTMLFSPTAAQQAALRELLEQQQDPKSANFHRWLTPEQYADRFGLSQNDINKISAWLQSQGFKVVDVARGRDAVTFRGDAAQVQNAFKTEIHSYDVDGKMHFANSIPPMIPAALSGIVGGFRGLHNFFPHPQIKPHPDYSITGAATHVIAPGDLATIYNINPLYQLATPIDGTNQKLVIIGQTDIYLADINNYRSGFGLSTIPSSASSCAPSTTTGVITLPCNTTNFQYVISGTGSDPGLRAGDISESDLDIEVSGSIARNAQIIFVTSSGGVGDSWSWAIDHNLAPVISISYGLCEAFNTSPPVATEDLEFQKAASMGISVFAASGDSGAGECDGDAFGNVSTATLGLSVNYPASSPSVTGVGGTEFNEGSGTYWDPPPTTSTMNFGNSAQMYIPELAWNDTKLVGILDATGGGPSNCENFSGLTGVNIGGQDFAFSVCDPPTTGGFAKPSYQTALTPSDSVRDVPDISFSASNVNDPYIVCTPQSEIPHDPSVSTSTCVNGITNAVTTYNSAFGGTSAATPLAAGMAALLNQYLGASGLGNINTQLYKLYGTNQSAFHNINTGADGTDEDASTNIVPCTSGTPSFEPLALRCPTAAGSSFGYSVVGGASYSSVTGLGSINFNTLFTAWKASLAPDFQLTASALTPSSVSAGQTAAATLTISAIAGSVATVVNFAPSNCSGLPAGATCKFSQPSVNFDGVNPANVTVTISTLANMALPSGAQTITITPTGSSNTSTTVSMTITATNQFFTLSPTNGVTITATVGGSATINLAVAGAGSPISFVTNSTTALPLTYTCTGTPSLATALITCQLPNNGQPSSAAGVAINLITTAPTAQLRRRLSGSRIFYALLLPGLFGIVFAAGSRTRGVRLLSLIVILGFSTLWLGSCSGSGGGTTTPKNPGTPPGSYAITIGATTGGAVPLTYSLTGITLNVSQ